MKSLRVGTRGSALALRQTEIVLDGLRARHPELDLEPVIFKPLGDRDKQRRLSELGGQGVFVREIELALVAGTIDLAVHSLKDLSGSLPEGVTLGAITAREDARDVWISRHGLGPQAMPRGATVGTSSPRRAAQLRALRDDFQVIDLRGNIDTRLRKARSAPYDAIVLGAAGLHRMGWHEAITTYLDPDVCLPMVGQGALGVECRDGDQFAQQLLGALDDPVTRLTTSAERAFLERLGTGCRAAIAAHATFSAGELRIDGFVGDSDGRTGYRQRLVERIATTADAILLGAELAARLLASGGAELATLHDGALASAAGGSTRQP